MLHYKTGDIFKSDLIPVVTINCVGAMGKGNALQCKRLYPATYKHYRQKCKQGLYKPGQPVLTNIERQLLLFPTKNDWRDPSKYEWIQIGLERIAKNTDKFDGLAIPPLGCGNGGLNWDRVKVMIERTLGTLDNLFEIYQPKEYHVADYKVKFHQYDDNGIHSEIIPHDDSASNTGCRVAITGGRSFNDRTFLFTTLDRIHAAKGITEIIHGGARGADSLGGIWAKQAGIKVTVFPADWNKHGKRAGILRNLEMINERPDYVVAFPGGRGTAHMRETSKAKGIEVIEVNR